jgi:hypothetical protein
MTKSTFYTSNPDEPRESSPDKPPLATHDTSHTESNKHRKAQKTRKGDNSLVF